MQNNIIDMNKKSQPHMSSMKTQINCESNQIHCLNSKNLILSKSEKVDRPTSTDEPFCSCSCEQISKLKQKAHKSFMQVIQIQNLYKEEIVQLRKYYEQRQKKKNQQYKQQEELFKEKCKELEFEIERMKGAHNVNRIGEIQIESYPFSVDNIQSIYYNPLDESNQSICNIKSFVAQKNLEQFTNNLKNEIFLILEEIESTCKVGSLQASLIQVAMKTTKKIFHFVNNMKQETADVCEKYNDQYRLKLENENKYNQLCASYENSQKEIKFMKDQIKRISNQKMKIEQKLRDSDRSNKILEEEIKQIKSLTQGNDTVIAYPNKKNYLTLNTNNKKDDNPENSNQSEQKTQKITSPTLKRNKLLSNCQLPASQLRKKSPIFNRH